MPYETLTVDITEKIAHVELNRPDAYNSMNRTFWREFPEAIRDIDARAAARVIVLSSTGKHFTAGMDLAVFTGGDGGGGPAGTTFKGGRRAENTRRAVLQLQEVFTLLEEVRMPVLAAIQGGCIGGGVDMVTACDSRYCTEDAFFSVKETDIGMTADLGTLQRLPTVMPAGLARELAYTGRRFYADEALQSGLVNRVFKDQAAMLDGVLQIAGEIAGKSPLAITGCKNMLNYARDHSVADGLNHVATWQSGIFPPEDMMIAFAAKAGGKPADFEEMPPTVPAMGTDAPPADS